MKRVILLLAVALLPACGKEGGGGGGLSDGGTLGSFDLLTPVDGKFTMAVGTGDDEARAIAIDSSGRILAAGYSFNGTNNDFAVLRLWP